MLILPPSQPKRLHEVSCSEDMGRFPVVVYVGATANVLVEMLFLYCCTAGRAADCR